MANPREPVIHTVPILSLRPTQMTVGMIEVKEKCEHWKKENAKKREEDRAKHMVPVVLGPDERHYVVDHHHMACALHKAGEKNIFITVIADLTMVNRDAFWDVMDNKRWVYPYDAKGKRHHFEDIPKSITGLKDDPFRSLAGALRREGGFAKDTTPFSEFLWADFLRRGITIEPKQVNAKFDKALKQALKLAKDRKIASYLPGWCGPYDG
jgi:hypothetical protein